MDKPAKRPKKRFCLTDDDACILGIIEVNVGRLGGWSKFALTGVGCQEEYDSLMEKAHERLRTPNGEVDES